MFGDYSIGDLGSIFVMQGFAGLILFFRLRADGARFLRSSSARWASSTWRMASFMILGAYVTWLNLEFLPVLSSGLVSAATSSSP